MLRRARLRLLAALGMVLLAAAPSSADIGVIVLEPVSALGFLTRVGHAGTYLSNICPDGSPVRMRICLPGEAGGVVSKSSLLSENEDYDWSIVPFEHFLHGVASADLAPLIATRKLQQAVEEYDFGQLFAGAFASSTIGELPEGRWRATLATRFNRSLYILSVETSPADDATIIAAFNAAPNKSRFNFFYRNCSNQVKGVLDLILPRPIGDRLSGISTETPKGLAKALVRRALENPELHLQVRRYGQIPGTFVRSRDVLFPMENTYRNLAFAPYWYFGGFREVAFGALFYHETVSAFDLRESSRDFMSPRAAALTVEQHQLRRGQDKVRAALTAALAHGNWSALAEVDAAVSRRLDQIRREKSAEVTMVAGSRARWQELERAFPTLLAGLPGVEVPKGAGVSERLLDDFAARGEFYIDSDSGGPWMRLRLGDGKVRSTGLSRAQILAGDPDLAALVLAAAIDFHLQQPRDRRPDIADVENLFTLFRKAVGTLGSE